MIGDGWAGTRPIRILTLGLKVHGYCAARHAMPVPGGLGQGKLGVHPGMGIVNMFIVNGTLPA